MKCPSCNDKGYVEYKTGVHLDGVDEIMKEPCICLESLDEIKKEREHVSDFMYIQSLEDFCEQLEDEVKHLKFWYHSYHKEAKLSNQLGEKLRQANKTIERYEKALQQLSEGKSSSGFDVNRLWLMGIVKKTLENSQTEK